MEVVAGNEGNVVQQPYSKVNNSNDLEAYCHEK